MHHLVHCAPLFELYTMVHNAMKVFFTSIFVSFFHEYFLYQPLKNVQGQGSWSKVKWVKPSLKVMILAGELTITSSCFILQFSSQKSGKGGI